MAWALAGRPAVSGGQDETCYHWAAPGRSQVRVRPISFLARGWIAFERRPAPRVFQERSMGARVVLGSREREPHPMSTPLLLRIGLFLCVHVGIVAGVLAFP